ncbi:MAG: hypothetical protein ACQETE_13515 [Bacteroidota bacterium]
MSDNCSYMVSMLLFVFITSCNTFDPDFERDNPSDVKSDYYLPDAPEHLDIKVEEGKIILEWDEKSKFEDGYIIEKSIRGDTSFTEIGRLHPDSTMYIDDSREIGYITYYKVSSYSERDSTVKKNSKVISIRVRSISGFRIEESENYNQINFSWECDSTFIGGLGLEQKNAIEDPYVKIKEFPNCNDGRLATSIAKPDAEKFRFNYRLSAYGRSSKKDPVVIDTTLGQVDINYPIIKSVEYLNEQEIKVTWEDYSSFNTEYILERTYEWPWEDSNFVTVAVLDSNLGEYRDELVLQNHEKYFYRIRSQKGDKYSKWNMQSAENSFHIDAPTLKVDTTTKQEIKISWKHSSDMVYKYIVERSINGGPYMELVRVDSQRHTYTDDQLNVSNVYKYKVRSLASESAKSPDFKFRRGYNLNDKVRLNYLGWRYKYYKPALQYLSNGKAALYSKSTHGVRDSEFSNTIYLIDLDNHERIDSLEARNYLAARYTYDGEILYRLNANRNGRYNLNAYEVNTGNIKYNVLDAHDNSSGLKYGGLDLNYDESLIATFIANDDEIRVWDSLTGTLKKVIEIENGSLYIYDIEFHPKKNELVILFSDAIEVINIEGDSGEKILGRYYSKEYEYTGDVRYSDTGDSLFYSYENDLYILESSNGGLIDKYSVSEYIYSIDYNYRNKEIALVYDSRYGYGIEFVDMETGENLSEFPRVYDEYVSFYYGNEGVVYTIHDDMHGSTKLIYWSSIEKWYPHTK